MSLKLSLQKIVAYKKGDILYVHKISVGKILQADKVIRGESIGNYKTNGEIFEVNVNNA